MEIPKGQDTEKLKMLFHKIAEKESLDAGERKLLRHLLDRAEWREVHQNLSDGEYVYGRLKDLERYSKREAFKKFSKQVYPSSGRKRLMWGISAAASVLLVVGLSLFLLNRPDGVKYTPVTAENIIPAGKSQATLVLSDGKTIYISDTTGKIDVKGMAQVSHQDGELVYRVVDDSLENEVVYNELIVPRGGEFNLTLEDGTRVRLNADSRLRYPVKFMDSERHVEVEGEAFFEVSRDENKPFIVSCNGIQMKVLGTSFNVNGYERENSIITTLVKGKLRVSSMRESVILLPGKQSRVHVNSGDIDTLTVNTEDFTAWLNNKFTFKDEPLTSVLGTLSRWYDVEFIFDGVEPGDYRLTGKIPRHGTLQEVTLLLEKIVSVNFVIEGRKVFVKKVIKF